MSRLKRSSDLEQTPAIRPLFVATGRGTNFLSCEMFASGQLKFQGKFLPVLQDQKRLQSLFHPAILYKSPRERLL